MTKTPKIILASGSAIRAEILRGAGIDFDVIKPGVDEDEIKASSAKNHAGLEETAMMLAEAKCMAVAEQTSGIVIGSDQILEFQGRAFDKPKTMNDARDRLLEMRGAAHTLINAVAVARDGKIIWRNLDRPHLIMRDLTEEEIDGYLTAAGPDILFSVGAYQVEGHGARLFERIDGDYFAVLGMSLFPLLGFLRREGALPF
ncbi:MAG: nucleoside triphosphate pyrophosphatase [Pseudomonadota bacterium]